MPALTTIDSFITMGQSLIILQINKLPFIKSLNTTYIYLTYLIFQLTNFAILYYIYTQMQKYINHKKLSLKLEPSFFTTTPSSESHFQDTEEITYSEYDMREFKKSAQSAILSVVLGSVMGLYLNSPHTLFTGILNVPKSVFLNPLYRQYLLGWEVKRPYSENRVFESEKVEEVSDEGVAEESHSINANSGQEDAKKFERNRKMKDE